MHHVRKIILIAHNIRSCHNIGSLLRTADGFGVLKVYLTGYTPYPHGENDTRLVHLSTKIHNQICKTALGAEESTAWEYSENILPVLDRLKKAGYEIVGLEQAKNSIKLPDYNPSEKVAILIGSEVEGIDKALFAHCSTLIEIPMFGAKESFNVVQATAVAVYHCRFA